MGRGRPWNPSPRAETRLQGGSPNQDDNSRRPASRSGRHLGARLGDRARLRRSLQARSAHLPIVMCYLTSALSRAGFNTGPGCGYPILGWGERRCRRRGAVVLGYLSRRRGIGQAVSTRLFERGARVLICPDRRARRAVGASGSRGRPRRGAPEDPGHPATPPDRGPRPQR
jgi:hypothetical protein